MSERHHFPPVLNSPNSIRIIRFVSSWFCRVVYSLLLPLPPARTHTHFLFTAILSSTHFVSRSVRKYRVNSRHLCSALCVACLKIYATSIWRLPTQYSFIIMLCCEHFKSSLELEALALVCDCKKCIRFSVDSYHCIRRSTCQNKLSILFLLILNVQSAPRHAGLACECRLLWNIGWLAAVWLFHSCDANICPRETSLEL